MKSGTRFELTNHGKAGTVDWHVLFVFGTSKSVRQIRPDDFLLEPLAEFLPTDLHGALTEELTKLENYLQAIDVPHLQSVWSHTGPGATRPFVLLDELSIAGERLTETFQSRSEIAEQLVAAVLESAGSGQPNSTKISANAPRILAGIYIGAAANRVLTIKPTPARHSDDICLPRKKAQS